MILSNPVKPECVAPDLAFKGSMVYWYNSTSYRCKPHHPGPCSVSFPEPLPVCAEYQSSP